MRGTVSTSWLMRTVQALDAIGRYAKALPQPAELYRTNASPTAYPLAFPGWDQYEREHATVNRDLQNAKTAVNSTAVFSDVQAIANEFSASEIIVKQRTQDGTLEDIDNHPLELLWESPNPHMGRSYVMSFWAWSYTLMGKAYLYWVPAGGQLREVWPVPSFMLTPARDDKAFVKGYYFKPRQDAQATLIPAEYITFSRSVNPFDPMDGMSFLAAALTSIKGDIAAAAWNTNFFSESNGVPDGLITVNKDTLDSDLMRIRTEIRDFFGGTRRGVAVARAGDMDYKPFGRTQKDAEFLEGRRFAAQEIGRALGIPDGYWSERANRANAEQARATMIAGAVWPLLVRLAEDLNAQLIPRWYGEDVRAEFKDIRPEDRALKLQEFAAYQAVLTVDELRDMLDKEPIGDVRGQMLVAEIAKGTPTPASQPSQETEDYISEQEQAAGVNEPTPEEGAPPPEGAPMPEAQPVEGGAVEELKAQTPEERAMFAHMGAAGTLRAKGAGGKRTGPAMGKPEKDTRPKLREGLSYGEDIHHTALEVGHQFHVPGNSRNESMSGTITKIGPKNITYDTVYMGQPMRGLRARKEDFSGGYVMKGNKVHSIKRLEEEDAAAEDLALWQTKALNTLRKKGRASCVFQSESLDDATKGAIAAALPACRTPQEVRAVFGPFSVKKADSTLQSRLAAILKSAQDEAARAIEQGDTPDLDALGARIGAELQAALVQEVLSGVNATASQFGVSVDAAAQAAQWAARYVPGAVQGMTDTTRQGLQAAIEAYRATPGMTREQLISTIGGLFGSDRAEMIADTEAARAQAQGTTITKGYLEGFGLAYDYQWQTSNDERTCAVCGPLNDQIVQQDNLPPAHPRCRCRVTLRLRK